jgi:hypothetical protein
MMGLLEQVAVQGHRSWKRQGVKTAAKTHTHDRAAAAAA